MREIVEEYAAVFGGVGCGSSSVRGHRGWASAVIRDVITALGYGASSTAASACTREPFDTVQPIRTDPRAAFGHVEILFPIALRGLLRMFPDDPVEVASVLMKRLLSDAASAVDTMVAQLPLTEVADHRVLKSMLTRREIEVFELILEGVPIKQISSRLYISSRTARNHMTNIGRKFSATGRAAVIRRAREVGALVAVPLAVATAAATDVASSIGSLL